MFRPLLILFILFAALMGPETGAAQTIAFSSPRIAVESRGRGPDVILIPGLASTPAIWKRTADRLDDRYTVHLVSIRGFGDVPIDPSVRGELMQPVSDEIRRYMASRRMRAPAVIGHSMGGLIALNLAADAGPGGVGRVMVVDASPFFPSLISPGATKGDVEPLAQIAYQAILFLGDQALQSQGSILSDSLGGAADSIFNSLGWQGGHRATLAQGLYEVMVTDLRWRLPSIAAPVTVVYGWSPDQNSPRAQVERAFRSAFATLPRAATFEPIQGAEHMVMIDQPRRFEAALDRFLD